MNEARRCNRCILADDFPKIRYNKEGVCNYCLDWDKKWKDQDFEKTEAKLVSILEKVKKKNRQYDCLIPFSGGRDSSYVVYLCIEKYKLNPLLVTFNNLFMSDYAISNINNLVELFDVEHRYITYKPKLLKRFYSAAIEFGGEFCSICSAGINYAKINYQKLYNIPIVITGVSGRADEQSPFEVNSTHPIYVRRMLSKAGYKKSEINDFVIKRHFEWSTSEKIKRKLIGGDYLELAMPDYVKWDNIEICRALQEDMNWQTPDIGKDHIDCKYAPLKNYLKNKQKNNYIFKQLKFSQLIRDGQMEREEGINNLEMLLKNKNNEPKELRELIKYLNLKENILDNLGSISHLDYISKEEIAVKESAVEKLMSKGWQLIKLLKK